MTTTVSSNTNTGGIWMIQTYKPQTDLVNPGESCKLFECMMINEVKK